MEAVAYSVALVTRGSGAFAYTYSGSAGLARGQLAAVSFRGGLELGIVLGIDPQPPAGVKLLPLWPLACHAVPYWGQLLLTLSELACAHPREVAGYLLFAPPASGCKLRLVVADPAQLDSTLLDIAGAAQDVLTPVKSKRLLTAGWDQLCAAAGAGALRLELMITGAPGQTRAHPAWRRWFKVDPAAGRMLNLPGVEHVLRGSYLAGLLPREQYAAWPAVKPPSQPPQAPFATSSLVWHSLPVPQGWLALERIGGMDSADWRRSLASWPELRAADGLAAEIGNSVGKEQSLLVIAPQQWMLDRLWPGLLPWAPWTHRFLPEAGPSAAAHLLQMLETPGQAVLGGPAAWKLAAYGKFQRVILLDPTHPQYTPEGAPWLDLRWALLAALALSPAQLDLVEMGLSAYDGASRNLGVELLPPHEADDSPPRPGQPQDTDPLPLLLRQPGRRRLVYFNRLGSSRRISCMECNSQVNCPACGSSRLHFSAVGNGYQCPACGFFSSELRCAQCGLASLAAQSPGLEAVLRRPGDMVVSGQIPQRIVHQERQSILGTTPLLQPPAGYWPQEIVYVHADDWRTVTDDWPRVLDETLRLAGLYDNPQLERVYIVSQRLAAQFGARVEQAALQELWQREAGLRRLAALPPWGWILYLNMRAAGLRQLADARRILAQRFAAADSSAALRLGRAYRIERGLGLSGYCVNPGLSYAELQVLRDAAAKLRVSLVFKPVWGPWQ